MAWERVFVYRIYPFVQMGILLEEEETFCYWKNSHFKNLDERFIRKWDSSVNSYILFSPHHTKLDLESSQRVIWIDPSIQNIEFSLTKNQREIIVKHFAVIVSHYPTRKLQLDTSSNGKNNYYICDKDSTKHVHFVELKVHASQSLTTRPKRIYVHPMSGGRKRTLLLDSGCEQSAINEDVWEPSWEVVQKSAYIDAGNMLISASGDELKQVHPPTFVRLTFGDVVTVQKFYIVRGLKTNLLGLDWIYSNQVSILAQPDFSFMLRFGTHPKLFPTYCQLKLAVTNTDPIDLTPG